MSKTVIWPIYNFLVQCAKLKNTDFKTVEVEFYNFEDWAANNLQNQEIGRKSPLGHRGGAGQGGSDGQVSDY